MLLRRCVCCFHYDPAWVKESSKSCKAWLRSTILARRKLHCWLPPGSSSGAAALPVCPYVIVWVRQGV